MLPGGGRGCAAALGVSIVQVIDLPRNRYLCFIQTVITVGYTVVHRRRKGNPTRGYTHLPYIELQYTASATPTMASTANEELFV